MPGLRGGAVVADGQEAQQVLLPPQLMSRRLTQHLLADVGWGLWLAMVALENAPRTTRIVTLWASVCFLASSLSFFPKDVNWVALAMQLIMLCINIHRTIHVFRPLQIVPPAKTKRRLRFLLNRGQRENEGSDHQQDKKATKNTMNTKRALLSAAGGGDNRVSASLSNNNNNPPSV